MGGAPVTIDEISLHDVDLVRPLWEALFDHHLSIGAAGLRTIEREESWPRRRAHYGRVAAEHPETKIWLVTTGKDASGYAFAYIDRSGATSGTGGDSSPEMMLETLSVHPAARGQGVGRALMQTVDRAAVDAGVTRSAVEVMYGNDRAHALYTREGFEPHSETWMRSKRARGAATHLAHDVVHGALADEVRRLGLSAEIVPGHDDTWETAAHIVRLTVVGQSAGASASASESASGESILRAISLFEACGLGSIQFDVPDGLHHEWQRGLLRREGFLLCTHRLAKHRGQGDPQSFVEGS